MSIRSLAARLTAASLLIATAAVATTAVAQPTKSYKDPNTGADCVQNTSSETSSSGNYVYVKYRNSCGLTFSIWGEAHGKKRSTGISPYGESQHTIPADEIGDFQWWVE